MVRIKTKHSIVIRRPVNDVFAFLVRDDLETRHKWMPGTIEYEKTPEGPAHLGTRSRQVAPDRSGRLVETYYEVIEYEPNRKLTVEAISRYISRDTLDAKIRANPAPRSSRYVGSTIIDAVGDHTRVTTTYEFDAEIPSWYRLLVPYWAGEQKRTGEESLNRLKNLIEAEAGLPQARKPFRLTWRWIAWGSYIVFVAALWWVYSSRVPLELSPGWEPPLRMTLSAMVVLAAVWIIVRYYILRQL